MNETIPIFIKPANRRLLELLNLNQIIANVPEIIKRVRTEIESGGQSIYDSNSLGSFIRCSNEFEHVRNMILEVVSNYNQNCRRTDQITDEIVEYILKHSLNKLEEAVLANIWGHAFYKIAAKAVYKDFYAIDFLNKEVNEYDFLEASDDLEDRFSNMFNALKYNLEKENMTAFNSEVWPNNIIRGAYTRQEEILSTSRASDDLVTYMLSGLLNALRRYMQIFKTLGDQIKDNKSLFNTLIRQTVTHFENTEINRISTTNSDGTFNPDGKITKDKGSSITTGCIALPEGFLKESYEDFVEAMSKIYLSS